MSEKSTELGLRVANLDCEHDAAAIERGMAGFPGLTELKLTLHACPSLTRCVKAR